MEGNKRLKIYGLITRVQGRLKTVDIRKFFFEKFVDLNNYNRYLDEHDYYLGGKSEKENIEKYFSCCLGPTLTLKFKPEIINDLIDYAGDLCEFEISEGMVISAKLIGRDATIRRLEEKVLGLEEISADMRNKLKALMSLLVEMEKKTWMVRRSSLIESVSKKFNIPRHEAEKLINLLIRTGDIYEPRKGYLKKT